MNEITEYKRFYVIEFKDWFTKEIPEEAYALVKKQILSKEFNVEIDWEMYNLFDYKRITKKDHVTDIDAYILVQPQHIKDKLKAYAQAKNIRWNSIDHVSNVVEAINKGEV